MANLDFSDRVAEASANIKSPEEMLSVDLFQPFTSTVSGARKLLASSQRTHIFPLLSAETPIISTGYESRFGDYSSSITRTEADVKVIGKISKFSFAPNHHYWLILEDPVAKKLDVQERISYHYITESYGFLYNNEFMDNINVGDMLQKGTVMQRSLAYSSTMERQDGLNLTTAYMALDENMEDSIVISDTAAGRLTSPLVKPVEIMINDNDIPLNIYGDDNVYKVIPDIGEDIKDANLIALRKEKKDEAYFTQSTEQLRNIMMSDSIKRVKGKVIDIDIYCNNPEILDTLYYGQLKMYYDDLKRYNAELVRLILPYVSAGYTLTYDLQKLFANAKRVCNGDQYVDKRTFSNIEMNIVVLEEIKVKPGDKLSNRYGGKGVVSCIWPKELMPRYLNEATGEYEYIDFIFNSSTMVNRENPGQVFEESLNHIGEQLLEYIQKNKLPLKQAYDMIHKFVSMCSKEQGDYMQDMVDNMTQEELAFFIESIFEDGNIYLSLRPISDVMTIDKLNDIYKQFPFIKQNKVEVVIPGSDGKIRRVVARRPMTIGKQYIFRLKQYAEEKFSATSLSATNIRNENTKSRAKKDYKELYPNTPIRFGNMETNNMNHLGADAVVANLMIHSTSPQGRRLAEKFYTGDPYSVDIRLNSDSKNRAAEIVNTYLKTIGVKLKFIKKRKTKDSIVVSPIYFDKSPKEVPIFFVPKDYKGTNKEYIEDYQKRYKDEQKKRKKAESPVTFSGGKGYERTRRI